MGVFQEYMFKHQCPECGKENNRFQTKAFGDNYDRLKVGDNVDGGLYDKDSSYVFIESGWLSIYNLCYKPEGGCGRLYYAKAIIKNNVVVAIEDIGYKREGE